MFLRSLSGKQGEAERKEGLLAFHSVSFQNGDLKGECRRVEGSEGTGRPGQAGSCGAEPPPRKRWREVRGREQEGGKWGKGKGAGFLDP